MQQSHRNESVRGCDRWLSACESYNLVDVLHAEDTFDDDRADQWIRQYGTGKLLVPEAIITPFGEGSTG